MFARHLSMRLRSATVSTFMQTFDKEILPRLRKQQGFLDVIALVNGQDAIAVSFWDNKEKAESYNEVGYPEIVKLLANLSDGDPQLRIFSVAASTLHELPVIRVSA
jgi:hypothetical protein